MSYNIMIWNWIWKKCYFEYNLNILEKDFEKKTLKLSHPNVLSSYVH